MMNAVYKGRAYRLLQPENEQEGWNCERMEDVETGEVIVVDNGDEDLTIDPTDAEYFACENVKPLQGALPIVPDFRVGKYTVRALKEDAKSDTMERCPEVEASAFGLYRDGEDGLPYWVKDYDTRAQAEKEAWRLFSTEETPIRLVAEDANGLPLVIELARCPRQSAQVYADALRRACAAQLKAMESGREIA